jgi:hypothetical protein|nr:MAG TPA: hypothetical protein [Caudoviricetes sp.]
MTLKELFDAVNALDIDENDRRNVKLVTIRVDRANEKFSFERLDGTVVREVIKIGDTVKCIPVDATTSYYRDYKEEEYNINDDVSVLPTGIRASLVIIGVLDKM